MNSLMNDRRVFITHGLTLCVLCVASVVQGGGPDQWRPAGAGGRQPFYRGHVHREVIHSARPSASTPSRPYGWPEQRAAVVPATAAPVAVYQPQQMDRVQPTFDLAAFCKVMRRACEEARGALDSAWHYQYTIGFDCGGTGEGLYDTTEHDRFLRQVEQLERRIVQDGQTLHCAQEARALFSHAPSGVWKAALPEAVKDDCLSMVRFLLDRGVAPKDDTLFYARSAPVAAALLARGARIKAAAWDGYTPLHEAATRGDTDVVQLLLQHGAQVNAETRMNGTALHIAAAGGHIDVVRLLLQRGADIHAKITNVGATALHCAALHGHEPVVDLLLRCGARIGAGDEQGMFPLHVAAREGRANVVELLCRRARCLVDAKNWNGGTPLHSAAIGGHSEAIATLLRYGAAPDAKNRYQVTPLHSALVMGHFGALRYLLRSGADAEVRTDRGATLLQDVLSREDFAREDGVPLDNIRNGMRALLEEGASMTPDEIGVSPAKPSHTAQAERGVHWSR